VTSCVLSRSERNLYLARPLVAMQEEEHPNWGAFAAAPEGGKSENKGSCNS
jgi:hypothetical protein